MMTVASESPEEEEATVEMLQALSANGRDDPEVLYKSFHQVLGALKHEINSLSTIESGSAARTEAHDALLEKISALSNWVVDVGPKLPTRDQEGYANNIRALQAHLRSTTNPVKKTRFKFKPTSPSPPPGLAPEPSSTAATAGSSPGSSCPSTPLNPFQLHKKDPRHHVLHFSLPNAIDSDSDVLPTNRPPAPTSVSRAAVAPSSHSVIADEVSKTLDLPSHPGRPVTLTGLHDCVVRNMSDNKIPALYVTHIRGCVVDGGWVVGSVFIQDVAESVIFVRGRQVRVHETRNAALVVDVVGQPVVEDCEGIKFYELDRDWLEERYGRDYIDSGDDGSSEREEESVERTEAGTSKTAGKTEPAKKREEADRDDDDDQALGKVKLNQDRGKNSAIVSGPKGSAQTKIPLLLVPKRNTKKNSSTNANATKNRWNEVLDFKWHKEGPSPNWTAIRREDVVAEQGPSHSQNPSPELKPTYTSQKEAETEWGKGAILAHSAPEAFLGRAQLQRFLRTDHPDHLGGRVGMLKMLGVKITRRGSFPASTATVPAAMTAG